jgi:hypothetical protein
MKLFVVNIERFKLKVNLHLKWVSLSIIFVCAAISTVNAQGFMMSSIGMMAGTSSNATALNFKSNANCIDVQSGIAVYNGVRSFGEFAVNCEITQQFNKLGIKLFPNPARTTTKIKFINTPPLTEVFSLTIWNTEGEIISTRKETSYTIFQGIELNVTNLISGSYVLTIESNQYIEAIKFIKAN